MKKALLITVCMFLVLAMCFVAVACCETPTNNGNGNNTNNNYGGSTYTPTDGGNGSNSGNSGNIDSHTHTYSTVWSHDNDYHWHGATCGHSIEQDKALHRWDDGVITTAATETTEGVRTYTCTVCGATKTEVLPVSGEIVTTATISFNLNGGHTSSTTTPITVASLDRGDFFFDVTKDGFNFRGWSCDGVKVFDEGGTIVNNIALKPNMTFVAEYSNTAKLTITTNMPDAGEYSRGGEFAYNSEVDVFAHPNQGYAFVGWTYNNAVLSNQIDYRYKMWDKDVALVAVFKYADFELTLTSNNADNGLVFINPTGVSNAYSEEKAQSFAYKTPVTIAAYTKTDVRFLGWFDEDNVLVTTNAVYSFNMPNYDYRLTAKWNYFTITYELDDGVNNVANPDWYDVERGTIYLQAPTKANVIFFEWQQDGQAVSTINPALGYNVVLTAVWGCSITYHLNGGTNSAGNPSTYSMGDSFSLQNPTRDYYTFDGWYTENTFSHKVTELKNTSSNVNLYAKWTPTQYTITYNLNGGTNSGSNPAKYTVESGAVTFSNATRAGYTFGGWYTNSACTQSTTGLAAGSHGDVTVYAKWNTIYTITYILNGGTNSPQNPSSYTVETIGDGVTLAPSTKETARNITDYESLGNGNYSVTYDVTAYTFLGWYAESDFVNQVTTITPADGNVTLYAKWSETTSTTTTTTMEQSYLRDGNYIYFGIYPQTEVTDSTIKTALNTMAGTLPTAENAQAWTSYGYYIIGSVSDYMWYIDLTYNGEKYRGVYFTSYRPYYTTDSSNNSEQDDNGYNTGNVYWFKFEPIKWCILSEACGEALILCEMIIDSQEYYPSNSSSSFSHNGSTGYANNYALSNIRKWLNDTFYNTAFNDMQKELILLTTVDNSARSTNPNSSATAFNSGNDAYACANTQDYVFLLSEQEVTTAAYGFSSSYSDYDTARRKKNTDYAMCQGAWTSTYSYYYGNGCWWLRSPSNDSFAYGVGTGGRADYYDDVNGTRYGVVPALKIRLS